MEFCVRGTSANQAGTWLHDDFHSQFRRHLLIQPSYNTSFLFTNICLETVRSPWMWGIRKLLQAFSCGKQFFIWNSASPMTLLTLVLLVSGKSLHDYFINGRKESGYYKKEKFKHSIISSVWWVYMLQILGSRKNIVWNIWTIRKCFY